MSIKDRFTNFFSTKEASVFAQMMDMLPASWSLYGSKANMDKLLAETYMMNAIAYRCIRELADNLSTIDFELYSTRGKGKEIDQHPLLDLLNRPNPTMAGSYFWKMYHTYKQATGNAYIRRTLLNGVPRELYVLPSQSMTVGKSKTGLIPTKYEYRPNPSDPTRVENYVVNPVTGDSDILHTKFFNPQDLWYGLAPLQAAAMSVDTSNEIAKWNFKLIQNGARPSGLLLIKANLDPERRKELEEKFMKKYSGGNNAGKPIFLQGDYDWKETSMSPKDMDFMNNKSSVAKDMASAFRIPPILLNIGSDSTYANMAEARLALWEETLLPEMDALVDDLNHWLVPMFGDNLELTYDKDKISALNDRRWKLYEIAGNADFLTINEKREMVGYDEIDGGDGLTAQSETPETEEEEVVDEEASAANADLNVETKALEPTGKHAGHYHKFDAYTQKGMTTETQDHSHEYILGAKFTSIVDGHRHELPVDEDE